MSGAASSNGAASTRAAKVPAEPPNGAASNDAKAASAAGGGRAANASAPQQCTPQSRRKPCQNLMDIAAPGKRFRTRHSACVHGKNGTLRSRRTLSSRANIAGNPRVGRSIETATQVEGEAKECAMTKMSKTLTALAAAATIAVAAVAVPQPAQALLSWRRNCRRRHRRSCRRRHPRRGRQRPLLRLYGPGYYYGPGPVYYRGPGCYWTHRRFWNGWAWHVRRVRVCD